MLTIKSYGNRQKYKGWAEQAKVKFYGNFQW